MSLSDLIHRIIPIMNDLVVRSVMNEKLEVIDKW
jgi:hypothetical protein